MTEEKDHRPNINTGNVQGVNVNIGGDQQFKGPVTITMGDMSQYIDNISDADETDKEKLSELLDQLRAELEKASPDQATDAQQVARRAEDLMAEASQENPDQESVEFKANKLKQAAEKLKEAMPIVLTVATQIVGHILKFGA